MIEIIQKGISKLDAFATVVFLTPYFDATICIYLLYLIDLNNYFVSILKWPIFAARQNIAASV